MKAVITLLKNSSITLPEAIAIYCEKEKGLSQTKFCKQLGIDPSRYSHWKHQREKMPPKYFDAIIALCDKHISRKDLDSYNQQCWQQKD